VIKCNFLFVSKRPVENDGCLPCLGYRIFDKLPSLGQLDICVRNCGIYLK